jgi:hypothetical protein
VCVLSFRFVQSEGRMSHSLVDKYFISLKAYKFRGSQANPQKFYCPRINFEGDQWLEEGWAFHINVECLLSTQQDTTDLYPNHVAYVSREENLAALVLGPEHGVFPSASLIAFTYGTEMLEPASCTVPNPLAFYACRYETVKLHNGAPSVEYMGLRLVRTSTGPMEVPDLSDLQDTIWKQFGDMRGNVLMVKLKKHKCPLLSPQAYSDDITGDFYPYVAVKFVFLVRK